MESPWILVLTHEFPPLGGGAGKNLYLLCRELTRRGVAVKVWTVDPGKRNQWKHEFPMAPMVIWHHGSDVHGGGPDGPGLVQRFMLRRVWKRSVLIFTCPKGC